jgi:hypothetical protein
LNLNDQGHQADKHGMPRSIRGKKYMRQVPKHAETRWLSARGGALVLGAALLAVWAAHNLDRAGAAPTPAPHAFPSAIGPATGVVPAGDASTVPSGGTGASGGGRTLTLAQELGIDIVERALHAQTPTGRGITAGHVEGAAGDYVPDLKAADFAGIDMHLISGESKSNGHANATARIVYGPGGVAPGIASVCLFTAMDWLGPACLHLNSEAPPDAHGCRLFNHSWIASDSAFALMALHRIDYLVDHDGVVIVAGVNNGAKTPIPVLLGSAYNVIAVGQAAGDSSGGYTVYDTVGRCKPDVVAPGQLTSFTTPAVTGVCARLMEAADAMKEAPAAKRPEVIKAVLMAGAEKPLHWAAVAGKPLDEHLGAGSVRFDHSYAILTGGPNGPGLVRARSAWDYRALPHGVSNGYELTLDHAASDLSIILTWNRRVTGAVPGPEPGRTQWVDEARLAHFDLALVRVNDTDSKGGVVVAYSASPIDNVQHIYLKNLPPGRYRFGVRRDDKTDKLDEPWDYALAWRVEVAP